MFRRSLVGLGALLGGFHLWLLGAQAWNGQLSEPDVVLRWIAALALGGGLVALRRRRGASLVSRQAVAMWVLAALLHGPALGDAHDGFATPALPEAVATLAQAVAALSVVGLTLVALFALATWPAAPLSGVRLVTSPVVAGRHTARHRPGSLPRPPPLA